MSQSVQNEDHSTWIKIVARLGFFAKGVIYISIGVLAFQIAVGMGGKTSGATQILKQFIYQPFGTTLLILCLIGLVAHAVWKFTNGFMNVEQQSSGASGLLFRSIEVIVGFIYLGLSYATLQILLGQGAKSSDKSTHIWIANILTLPYGKWIVFVIAFIAVIIGGYQFYYAYTEGFTYRFDFSEMNSKVHEIILKLGKIGIGSWGIVYFMMAFLFYQAAANSNPDEAGGLGDALSALAKQPYGAWILGITSLGLIIYGIYLFILSYYSKI